MDAAFSQSLATQSNRVGIAVDTENLHSFTQQGSRVTAVSQRGIDCPPRSPCGLTHLLQEDRQVIDRSLFWHLEL
jgi:hypothetical protein